MSINKKIFSVALMFILCGCAFAGPWSSLGPKRKPVTLVITSNYVTPRLLAELILNESGTQIAAVTTAVPKQTSAAPDAARENTFRADRPFVILVVDEETQAVLLSGIISQP